MQPIKIGPFFFFHMLRVIGMKEIIKEYCIRPFMVRRKVSYKGIDFNRHKVIAITGTAGKSSSAFFLYQFLQLLGYKVGISSTAAQGIGDTIDYKTGMTMLGPEDLCAFVHKCTQESCDYIIVEASSHGIWQQRHFGLKIYAAAMTNISEEHLDYHGSMPVYLYAKSRIFKAIEKDGFAILNERDQSYEYLRRILIARSRRNYSFSTIYDEYDFLIAISNLLGRETVSNHYCEQELRRFPMYQQNNLLMVIKMLVVMGCKCEDVIQCMSEIKALPGRFERVTKFQKCPLYIDYAHTPKAITELVRSMRAIHPDKEIVIVSASGSTSYYEKIEEMAHSLIEAADKVIISLDIASQEQTSRIQAERYLKYFPQNGILTRKEAIKRAIKCAGPHSVIILSGVGHKSFGGVNDYQILNEIMAEM